MNLTDEQQEAVKTLVEKLLKNQREVILTGPPGSGKTAILQEVKKELKQRGRDTVFMAPTGVATRSLAKVANVEAATVASKLYPPPIRRDDGTPVFIDPKPVCSPGDVVVIDEASALSEKVYNDLQEVLFATSPVLYVGDPDKLPPVESYFGPNLYSPDVHLTEVHRQGLPSPIRELAESVNNTEDGRLFTTLWGLSSDEDKDDPLVHLKRGDALDWIVDHRRRGSDAAFIVYGHEARTSANTLIRERLGLTGVVDKGDILLIRSNSKYGTMADGSPLRNGTFVNVTDWRRTNHPDILEVNAKELSNSIFINAKFLRDQKPRKDWWKWKNEVYEEETLPWYIQGRLVEVTYGQAICVHTSHSLEWEYVLFAPFEGLWQDDKSGPEESAKARQAAYTAVTRASKQLVIVC